MVGRARIVSGQAPTTAGRAVCAGCGCLCDDIPLEGPPYRQGEPNVDTSCERGRRWFARRVFAGALSAREPEVGGEPAGLQEAATRAATLLDEARHPRVAGLQRLPLSAQRRLVELADRAGADIDVDASPGHLATVLAVQRQGGPFVTLGEIRQRADCLVLWFVEPRRTHPRLLERFYPPSFPGGGERSSGERTLLAVGPRPEETGADATVRVEPEDSLRFLWLLRLLADDPAAPEREEDPLGEEAHALLRRLLDARCGAWLYDGGARAGHGERADAPRTGHPARHGPVETTGILEFLHQLNEQAPWGARPLRGEGNLAGGEAVLTWQSGYPASVTYRSGEPSYAGPAYAAARASSTASCDVVLLVGDRPSAAAYGEEPACVWLDTGAADGPPEADAGGGARDAGGEATEVAVRIPVPPPGARAGDTLLRMDGLPVRSPGLPEAGAWDGVAAGEAVDAIVGALTRSRTQPRETGP